VSGLALIVIAGWLALLAAGFDLVLAFRLDQQIDDALRVRAQASSGNVQIAGNRITGIRQSPTDSVADSSIWVYAGAHALERPNLPVRVQRVADRLASAPAGYATAAHRRFYVLPVSDRGEKIGTVVAAIDTETYEDTKHTAVLGSAIVAVLLLVGAYPVLRLATGRALRPVARMTDLAAEWSVSAPTQRFGDRQQYAELSSLASTLDELLDRLAAVLRHERRLSAELSHELRTPLARVMAEVDLMLDDARPDQRPALQAVRDSCASMDRIMDTLLAAARTELVRTVGHSELDPILTDFATSSGPVLVTARCTGLTVGVDVDVVARMLAPIVENARRYARSKVELAADRVVGGIAVSIVNDGPPVPRAFAEQIFEPGFTRGHVDGHDGAGLGLALARRLARAADGDLVVDSSAELTTFVLRLPGG
jgi:signal transduction histidine kinase